MEQPNRALTDLVKIFPHSVDGEEYEIKAIRDELSQQLTVAIFRNTRRVGHRYNVSFDTNQDFGHYALDALISLVKNDLDSGLALGAVKRKYKDFVIEIRSFRLLNGQDWGADVSLQHRDDPTLSMEPRSHDASFQTRNDAIEGGFRFGRELADREHK
ncbi:MAG: hypothetical protein IT167_29560 [Bryobacterales bacterium]|nr:hypothetical protein [Bryobacterales bacterium]